jgi:hypothetical protein
MDEKWFKEKKKLAGVTNSDIAALIGRDHTVVSKLVAGTQRMTYEWAQVFAEALDVPVSEVMEKAGLVDRVGAQMLRPGFRESDVVPLVASPGNEARAHEIARLLAATASAVEVWVVKSRAMALAGFVQGDYVVMDKEMTGRLRRGDYVIARAHLAGLGLTATVLRRFEPPVLVPAHPEPGLSAVQIIDEVSTVILGMVVASWRPLTGRNVLDNLP